MENIGLWGTIVNAILIISGAAVGIVDDMTKFRRKQNEGLTPGQKLILQTAFALAYLLLLRLYGHIDTSVYLPYFNRVLDIGILFYPLYCQMGGRVKFAWKLLKKFLGIPIAM